MRTYRSINIDLDVHKVIENGRQAFSEDANTVLRRLLGLSTAIPVTSELSSSPPPQNSPAKDRSWSCEGICLPYGTKFRMTYNNHTHQGEIVDGMWVINGTVYSSPSGAAIAVARTRRGKPTRLNGWSLWEVKRPEDQTWIKLDDLRPKPTLGDFLELLDLDKSPRPTDDRWVDDVLTALHKLGGSSELPQLYRLVQEIRAQANRSWPENAEAAIRQALQAHCADSSQYQGATDLFRNVERGRWALK